MRFQSTFPRRERLAGLCPGSMVVQVSIHVPAKGTTVASRIFASVSSGFNPRSREGNDNSYSGPRMRSRSFNPRSREGNDTNDIEWLTYAWVSIHVPAKGTTAMHILRFRHCSKFQSTFPRRERRYTAINGTFSPEFQSTFPRRERHHGYRSSRHLIKVSIHVPAKGTTDLSRLPSREMRSFNPRSREGNDCEGGRDTAVLGVSIHVPAKGTTRRKMKRKQRLSVSIHVPAKGTTIG